MDLTELTDALANFNFGDIVFVGLGNEYRTDDRAGLLFFDRLKNLSGFAKSHFINVETNPENHLEQILGCKPKAVVFIDAVKWGGNTGDICFIPSEKIDSLSISTHCFSVKMVEQYLLKFRDIKFFYVGIQPATTQFGYSTSKEIDQKVKTFFNN
jgi:hydrogenase 3 maturation protease